MSHEYIYNLVIHKKFFISFYEQGNRRDSAKSHGSPHTQYIRYIFTDIIL